MQIIYYKGYYIQYLKKFIFNVHVIELDQWPVK